MKNLINSSFLFNHLANNRQRAKYIYLTSFYVLRTINSWQEYSIVTCSKANYSKTIHSKTIHSKPNYSNQQFQQLAVPFKSLPYSFSAKPSKPPG